jgi:hypothetical protein
MSKLIFMEEFISLFKDSKIIYNTKIVENFNSLNDGPVKCPIKEIDNIFLSNLDNEKMSTSLMSTPIGLFKIKNVENSESSYVDNYGNQFSFQMMTRRMVVIDYTDTKISLKFYAYESSRKIGKRYRKIRKNVYYLTFNFKTKMFYTGYVSKKNKKLIGQSKFSVNVKNLSNTPPHAAIVNYFDHESKKIKEVYDIFFKKIIEKTNLNIDTDNYTNNETYALIQFKLTGIKYPNNFKKFLSFYFTKKHLKPYDYNLVSWFMGMCGLKGSKVRKLLNEKVKLDLGFLVSIFHMLGIDHFNKLNDNVFDKIYSTDYTYYSDYLFNYKNELKSVTEKITKLEKSNLAKIFNDGFNDQHTLYDHLKIKNDLLVYGENVFIKAKTHQEFIDEHNDWSKLLQSYKEGLVERFYGDDSVLIEAPFRYNDETYYPVLLKTTDQYNEESNTQHNCVRSYSEKPYCFIVSLRKGSKDSKERITIEYRLLRDKVHNIQSRSRFNGGLSEEWKVVVNKLDDFANYLYIKEAIKLPVMVKKYMNGKTIKTNAAFVNDEKSINMYPVWLDGHNSNYHYDLFDEINLI